MEEEILDRPGPEASAPRQSEPQPPETDSGEEKIPENQLPEATPREEPDVQEETVPKPRRRKRRWIRRLLFSLLLLLTGGWVFLFYVNQFSLEIRIQGEESVQLEYGSQYQEPGAQVWLRGTLVCPEGIPMEKARLQITSDLQEDLLGRYQVYYHAALADWRAEAWRQVCVIDTESPVITLVEDTDNIVVTGQRYQDPGFTARDNYDGDLTDRVITEEIPGKITYSVIDSSGNPAVVERKIPIYDIAPPDIQLVGGTESVLTVGTVYEDPGFTAVDDLDGDVTDLVTVEGEVNWLVPGLYPVTYTVADSFGNEAVVTRNVEVQAKPRPEVKWPQKRTIYLTFDDGPGPYTTQLLDILDAYNVKATFFVTDSGYNAAMRQIVNRGHSIGIHTVSHNYGEIYSSPEAYFQDLYAMQRKIYETTGVLTTLMRFPGGSSNLVSRDSYEGLMTILDQAVQDAGFQYFDWNVDSNDAGGARTARRVADNVIAGVQNQRVSMVLQHDVNGFSVDAVEEIIQWGKRNGYQFLPITETTPGLHHGVNN